MTRGLPEGVKTYDATGVSDPYPPDGESLILLSDLPKIEQAVEARVREALSREGAVLAFNATLHGRGLNIHHDYEDTVAALQAAADAALKPNGAEEA